MMRWLLPVVCAAFLLAMDLSVGRVVQLRLFSRGSVAPYTVRAVTDAVFDLRQTHEEEARAARRNYLPIYNKDNAVLYEARGHILSAAQREGALWISTPDGGVDGALSLEDTPSGEALADGAATLQDRRVTASPSDGGIAEDGAPGDAELFEEAPSEEHDIAERLREVEALIRGFFEILEPYYKRGVIADNEFPAQKKQIRVLSVVPKGEGTAVPLRRYVLRSVARLHRFSDLRPALEQADRQFFFGSDVLLRARAMELILERLPPNLTYAAENKRVIDISEVTGVRVVLIRRGEVLARRGQIIDSRAYHAIAASVAAADRISTPHRAVGQCGLLVSLLLLFVIAAREIAPRTVADLKPQLLLYGGILIFGVGGAAALARWPIDSALLPQATIALCFAVVLGRAPALLVAVVVPTALGIVHVLDVSGAVAGVAGGAAGALVMRRRQRNHVLAAGVLIGLVQALVVEAARAFDGRPQTSTELLQAAQAFGGGILAGLAAVLSLPFIQRWFGVSGRGKLEVLGNYDHPLARQLRERAPDIFAHTVRVVTLADYAANALNADRMLTRCGALYHDMGKTSLSVEGTPEEQAQREIDHVAESLRLAEQHRLPADVRRLIAEHHGTTRLTRADESPEDAAAPRSAQPRYPGPKPTSPESAALMIADRVEHATRGAPPEVAEQRVVEVVQELLLDVQFEHCKVTQGDLQRVVAGLVDHLRDRG